MPRAKRTCSDRTDDVTCPQIAVRDGRCDAHASAYEQARGTRQQRGYGRKHDLERLRWVRPIMAGRVACWRCGDPIVAGQPWDLGHHDDGTTAGPEHPNRCNRRAAGLKTHGLPWMRNDPQP